MSDQVNGAPPALPNLNPRELPKDFQAWPTMVACVIMDNETAHLAVTVGQLRFAGQHQLAEVYEHARQQLAAMREQFYRQQQGGLVIAGPGDVPKGVA